MDWTMLLIIGLAAGVLAGLFGIGGGVVIVPALTILARMPLQSAIGTSLGALLLPVGALGAWSYWRSGHLDIRAAMWVALGLFLGAYGGARLAQSLGDVTLRRAFALFLAAVAVKVWVS